MKNRKLLLLLAAVAVLLLGAAQSLSAGVTVTVASSDSIAPSSIPVPESGTLVVGMNRVKLTSAGSGVTSLGGIRVQLLSSRGIQRIRHPVHPGLVRTEWWKRPVRQRSHRPRVQRCRCVEWRAVYFRNEPRGHHPQHGEYGHPGRRDGVRLRRRRAEVHGSHERGYHRRADHPDHRGRKRTHGHGPWGAEAPGQVPGHTSLPRG